MIVPARKRTLIRRLQKFHAETVNIVGNDELRGILPSALSQRIRAGLLRMHFDPRQILEL